MSALDVVLVLAAVAIVGTFIAGLVTGDSSWVDRIWSIVPVVYVWVFAGFAHGDARLVLVAVLVTLWGARLTFNFARKGGYTGMEDYRWAILRGRMTGWQYQLFSFFFISGYQNVLLVLITLPALTMSDHRRPLTAADVILAALFLFFLTGETVADQQQWNFHRRKAGRRRDPAARVRQHGAVEVESAPELLLRAGAVVGGVLLRRGGRAQPVATDGARGGAADPAVRRFDDLHRIDLRREVSRPTPTIADGRP